MIFKNKKEKEEIETPNTKCQTDKAIAIAVTEM